MGNRPRPGLDHPHDKVFRRIRPRTGRRWPLVRQPTRDLKAGVKDLRQFSIKLHLARQAEARAGPNGVSQSGPFANRPKVVACPVAVRLARQGQDANLHIIRADDHRLKAGRIQESQFARPWVPGHNHTLQAGAHLFAAPTSVLGEGDPS